MPTWAESISKYFNGPRREFWALSEWNWHNLPDQGWKIHVSCCLLSSENVIEIVGNYVKQQEVAAKAASSPLFVKKLNSGLHYGYSQIGKVITIYPSSINEFYLHVNILGKLLSGQNGPRVPFEKAVPGSNIIFYRYGAFRSDVKLVDQNNTTIEDDRTKNPFWAHDPFPGNQETLNGFDAFHPRLHYYSRRGKGAVSKALDLGSCPPKLVIIKEGFRYGEIDDRGCDGFDLLRREVGLLYDLKDLKIVPAPLDYVEKSEKNYACLELFQGSILTDWLRRSNLRVKHRLSMLVDVAEKLHALHKKGIAWRDLKPQNIIVCGQGVKFIDLEGYAKINSPNDAPHRWGSPLFTPPEWLYAGPSAHLSHDIYSFGVLIYFSLTNVFPKNGRRPCSPGLKNHSDLDRELLSFSSTLRNRNWRNRPNSRQVLATLKSIKRLYYRMA